MLVTLNITNTDRTLLNFKSAEHHRRLYENDAVHRCHDEWNEVPNRFISHSTKTIENERRRVQRDIEVNMRGWMAATNMIILKI